MSIHCDRCGRSFKKWDNLRRHLNRVYLCQPLIQDIAIELLQTKYACKKGIFKCENCGKDYKTSSGKSKHKKKCVTVTVLKDKIINNNETLLQEALNKVIESELSREKLENQVKELLQKQCVQNITNNNFIIINNFGEENTDYLREDNNAFLQKCMDSPMQSIKKYLDAVHFNKEHPENNNIKLTNLQSPFMDYFKNGNWNKVEQQVLIPRLINNSVKIIHSLIEDEGSVNWYQYRNQLGDTIVKQKIKSKAKGFIYNRTLSQA